MTITRIVSTDIGQEGNGLVEAGKTPYVDTVAGRAAWANRTLEIGNAQYPYAEMASRYQNRFLDSGVIGVGEGDFRIWGSAQSGYNIPFEQAWQNLSASDFLTLLYEDGLNTGSYATAQDYIDAITALLAKHDSVLDIDQLRPDGIITFLSIRDDADYLDYITLGVDGPAVGPLATGIDFAASTTITRDDPGGSWLTDGFYRGCLARITNATNTANNKIITVYDVTDTLLYFNDGDDAGGNNTVLAASTGDTTATVQPISRAYVPTAVREYYRTIYEANNAGKSRLLTTSTRANITANEQSFVSSDYSNPTYSVTYSNDRVSTDPAMLYNGGGYLVFPLQSANTIPANGPSFGWTCITDFGVGAYPHAPDPALIKSRVDTMLPSTWAAVKSYCERFKDRCHKLIVKASAGGAPSGTVTIDFPYFRTVADEVTGFAFNNTSHTIVRNDGGSWVTDGYVAGRYVRITGGTTGNASTTPKLIGTVSASTLTLDAAETLTTASGDKTVVFDAMERSGAIDISLAASAKVGIGPINDPVNGFDITSASRIDRTDGGSFLNDGFVAGDSIIIENATSGGNNGTWTTSSVSATRITVTSATMTNGTDDKTMTIRRTKTPQLRDAVKTALDAMSTTPPCFTFTWWNDAAAANARRVILIYFFDENKVGGVWDYNPPYAGHYVPADSVTGFNFVNNTAPTKDTITRNDGGSWITDGFTAGKGIRVANATNSANNGCYIVDSSTASVLTLKNRSYSEESGTALSADFPLSLTTSSGDKTATFRHTGYGVPVYSSAEISYHPDLYVSGVTTPVNISSVTLPSQRSNVHATAASSAANSETEVPYFTIDFLKERYFTDATNGIGLGTGSSDRIVRYDGSGWRDDGWEVGDSITLSNSTNPDHNGTYTIDHFRTTNVPNDTIDILTVNPFVIESPLDYTVRIANDKDGGVTDLYGKCVFQPTQANGGAWLEDYLTPWWAEYKDLGGIAPPSIFFDYEPKLPTISFSLAGLSSGGTSIMFGGSSGTDGLQAQFNYVKYITNKPFWDDYYSSIDPTYRSQLELSFSLQNSDQLQQSRNKRLQDRQSNAYGMMQRLRGIINAAKASFPNVVGYAAHTSIGSSDIPFHGQHSHPNYYTMFSTAVDGNCASQFNFLSSTQRSTWNQLVEGYTPTLTNGEDTAVSVDCPNSYDLSTAVKDIARDGSSIVTVNTFNATEIRAKNLKGNFKAFNGYFLGQYIQIYPAVNSTNITTVDDFTHGSKWPILRPVLSLGAADGDGLITSLTYQDFYFKDATNGIDFGVGGTNRIVKQDGTSWANDGWATSDAVIVSNATNAAHNGTYAISSFTTTTVSGDTMVLTTSPFTVSQQNDITARVARGIKTTATPSFIENNDHVILHTFDLWHNFLWNCEFFRGTFNASRYPSMLLRGTYILDKVGKKVTYGGLLGSLSDLDNLDYHAEYTFHRFLHNVDDMTYSGGNAATQPEQVLRYEQILSDALIHLNSIASYNKTRPLSLNSLKPRRSDTEYIVSGAILPNNRRLFRTTIRLDAPQDMTVPGAAAQSTHTPGPIRYYNDYTVFQTRFGVEFKVPGQFIDTDDFNTTGWWTIS
jgi:hypothetical protein